METNCANCGEQNSPTITVTNRKVRMHKYSDTGLHWCMTPNDGYEFTLVEDADYLDHMQRIIDGYEQGMHKLLKDIRELKDEEE